MSLDPEIEPDLLAQIELTQLRERIIEAFNEGELRTLCFDLSIDYDSLDPGGKADKARGLVAYCQRVGRLPDLIAKCQQSRSRISWPSLIKRDKESSLRGHNLGDKIVNAEQPIQTPAQNVDAPSQKAKPLSPTDKKSAHPSLPDVVMDWFGVEDDLPYRQMMRQIAVGSALFTVLVITFIPSHEPVDTPTSWLNVFMFGTVGSILALLFAETMTFLQLILSHQTWVHRTLGLTVTGAVIGHFLFLILTVEPTIWWFAGGMIGGSMALMPHLPQIERPVSRWGWAGLVGLTTAVIISLVAYDPLQTDWWLEPVAAVMVGLFATLFVRYALRPLTMT